MPPEFEQRYLDAWESAKNAFRERNIAEAERLCSTLPKTAATLGFMGRIQAVTGRTTEALETLHEALAFDPDRLDTLNLLATVYSQEGDYAGAVPVYEKLADLHPDSLENWSNLGVSYLLADKLHEAVDALTKCLSMANRAGDPNQPQVVSARFACHYRLGVALLRLNRIAEAETNLKIAVELDAANVDAWYALGQCLIAAYDPMAGYCFERAAAASKAGPFKDTLNDRAANYGFETLEEAETWLKAVIERAPEDFRPRQLLGITQVRLGKFDEARESFLKLLELNPGSYAPYLNLVNLKKVTPEDQELVDRVAELSEKPDVNPDDRMRLYYALGKANDDLGRYEEAFAAFRMANRLHSELHGAPFDRAQTAAMTDYVIARNAPEFFAQRRELGSDSELPLFILGMMRSGTTLTDRIVSSHHSMASAGELIFWYDRATSFDPSNASEAQIMQVANDYLNLLRRHGPGALRVIDKAPPNYWHIGSILLTFPKARIIHTRRHPVDVCLSNYMTFLADPPTYVFDPDDLVFAYREYERLMAHWRQILPAEQFLEVEYCKLVEDTESVTRSIIDFCGLEWDEACLHPEENRKGIGTASKWQARQPVYKSSLNRWKRYEPWLGAFRKLLDE